MKVNIFLLVALLLCGLIHEYECFSSNQDIATCFSSSACRLPASTTTLQRASRRYPSLQQPQHQHVGANKSNKSNSRLFASISRIDLLYGTELRERILEEFDKGSAGLDKDGKQLFLPGITAILSYPLVAQEAWILGVSTSRGGNKDDIFEPRYLKDRLAITIDRVYEKELKDRILEEFSKGSAGLNSDGKQLFSPGITAVLSYPLAAQEAWIIGVSSARPGGKNKRGDADVFKPRYLKTDELPKSIAVKKLTPVQWFKRNIFPGQ